MAAPDPAHSNGTRGMPAQISFREVTKRYGKTTALDKVSIDVSGPGVVALLGPNGAGKTTFLKLLNRLSFPSSGEITVNGFSIDKNAAKVLGMMASQVDETRFHPYLSGREILRFVASLRGINGDAIEKRIEEVSSRTGISPFLDNLYGTYSSGMKQKFANASALVPDSPIISFDEPTANLDPAGVVEFRSIIEDLKAREKLVLISSHILSEVRSFGNRILIINAGRIVFDSSRDALEKYLSIRLESTPESMPEKIKGVSEVQANGDVLILKPKDGVSNSTVISELLKSGLKIREVSEVESLEKAYISRVSNEK